MFNTVQERKGFQSEEGEEREPIAKMTSTQKSKTHKPAGPVNLRQKVPEPSLLVRPCESGCRPFLTVERS